MSLALLALNPLGQEEGRVPYAKLMNRWFDPTYVPQLKVLGEPVQSTDRFIRSGATRTMYLYTSLAGKKTLIN